MTSHGDAAQTLVFEADFDEPPEKLWRALTEPALLAAWLLTDRRPPEDPPGDPAPPRAAPDPQQGPSGRIGSIEYEILRSEPVRLLRYRWCDRDDPAGDHATSLESIVTVELLPRPSGGTHLKLTHGHFEILARAPRMSGTPAPSLRSALRSRTRTRRSAVHRAFRRAA